MSIEEPVEKLNFGINYFSTFRMVAKYGSFSKTAEKLMISEGAVRHRIDTIEKYLGLKLLDRNANGVKITEPGSILLMNLNKLNEFMVALDSVRRKYSRNQEKIIKICGGEIAILEILPEILKGFKRNHRETEIFVEAGHAKDCITKLLDREINVALVGEFMFSEFSDEWNKLLAFDIYETPLCVTVSTSNPLASRQTIALNELRLEHIIRRTSGSATQAIIDKLMGKDRGSNGNFHLEMRSSAALLHAVSMNLGIGVVSEVQARKFSKKSEVKILRIEPPLNIKLKIVVNKEGNGVIVEEFLDYVKKVAIHYHTIEENDKTEV